jgi:iron complex transport system ATP-binding protein
VTRLVADLLSLGYERAPVVRELSVEIPEGQITAIIGANGCGKSTLLRGLARLLKPRSGSVLLDGQAIHSLPTRRVAQRIGLLPQGPVTPDGIIVEDLVSRGRYPHQTFLRQWSRADERHVDTAIAMAGIDHLRGRIVDELSGGERQRVWIALALAQGTDVMLLDEPTTFLDVAHQVEVLDLLASLNAKQQVTVVLVLHDINQASRYAAHIIAMSAGQIYAEGPPTGVVTPEVIERVFGTPACVISDPVTNTPLFVPAARRPAPSQIVSQSDT